MGAESGEVVPLIEVGVLSVGSFDATDRAAISEALATAGRRLEDSFPQFRWSFQKVRHADVSSTDPQEPSYLLQHAAEQRDISGWDFVILITSADLIGHYRPFALAVLSRPLDAAVISTSRIDPLEPGEESAERDRTSLVSERLATLMLQAVAHLGGLDQDEHEDNLLYHPATAQQLDEMQKLDIEQQEALVENLRAVADLRLEETGGRRSAFGFYLQAAWINRGEIADAILAARPWQFPHRLSRLTTAAVSTVAVLLMTAEAWDLGLNLIPAQLVGLIVIALLATTLFVILRQQLLLRRAPRLTEQTVVTRFAAFGIVFSGMLTTWTAMVLLALLASTLLYSDELIAEWAPAALAGPEEVGRMVRTQMSLFAASVGIMIGSLGASFEDQHFFRHIIFVDEEI